MTDFFWNELFAFLLGVLQKMSGKTWRLDGEFVVVCVVNVVV
jgi:hypothetical protein